MTESFLLDTIFVVVGIHYTSYLLYAKFRLTTALRKYKPGTPEYDARRKLYTTPRYLIIATAVTTFFGVSFIVDARRILHSQNPHSILVVAPIAAILIYVMALGLGVKVLKPNK